MREGVCDEKENATNTSNEREKSKREKERDRDAGFSTKKKSYWKEAEKSSTKEERKVLVAEALSVLCKVIMNNHVYNFEGKTLLQEGKGCIGDRAIGSIASVVMIWWSEKFKEKLDELKIVNDFLKIYVDDVNGVYKKLKAGTEYKNGSLSHSEE